MQVVFMRVILIGSLFISYSGPQCISVSVIDMAIGSLCKHRTTQRKENDFITLYKWENLNYTIRNNNQVYPHLCVRMTINKCKSPNGFCRQLT